MYSDAFSFLLFMALSEDPGAMASALQICGEGAPDTAPMEIVRRQSEAATPLWLKSASGFVCPRPPRAKAPPPV